MDDLIILHIIDFGIKQELINFFQFTVNRIGTFMEMTDVFQIHYPPDFFFTQMLFVLNTHSGRKP